MPSPPCEAKFISNLFKRLFTMQIGKELSFYRVTFNFLKEMYIILNAFRDFIKISFNYFVLLSIPSLHAYTPQDKQNPGVLSG